MGSQHKGGGGMHTVTSIRAEAREVGVREGSVKGERGASWDAGLFIKGGG